MGGSAKQNTSTQSVSIPPEVLARYTAANDAASTAAAQPFQQYSTDPSAFVAPMSATQNAGVAATNAAAGQAQPSFAAAQQQLQDAQGLGAGMTGSAQTALLNGKNNSSPYNGVAGNYYDSAYQGAQPYNQAATGLAAASAQAVDPSNLDGAAIGKYMSPYLQTVLGGTAAQLNQDNQKAMSGQTGSAISQGAFGGDRSGIAAATLAGQQQLANAQIYSGILNTGYNNALGAAQQQQGVGLGAAQANRAALAGAGQQLQSIGQQQYGQGTTTGQAQQGLGQQVFGQGLSTSQQEAALGQQEYTMGANTAQEQAGIGAGAQSAALQGAQAQLAAGQVQQQTQQAGDTALYNQFLQQQSYPFQTAQFLANVAEGTGSLSGSTTTTTQPGGFFSDERLKEDIKKIGKTFDGQVIYSFKYKGDPRTQVGLMAQDVEKKTPDAVGESHGYKTVDYDKATEKSAERGHFAGGGSPMLPGLSGADMSALLAAQEQMYAPFSQAGGLYGGQSGGMPRGGSSYVPQGNLPVSHLTVAGGLAPQRTTAENTKDIVDTAAGLQKAYDSKDGQKFVNWVKGGANDNHTNDNHGDLGDDPQWASGGLVPAKRYASGGMPYDAQTGLDIPDETPTSKLQTAGELPGQKSGADNTKDAVGTALAVAKLAAMFMNRGGRAGFADGGSPGDDTVDFATPSDGGASGNSGHYEYPMNWQLGTGVKTWVPDRDAPSSPKDAALALAASKIPLSAKPDPVSLLPKSLPPESIDPNVISFENSTLGKALTPNPRAASQAADTHAYGLAMDQYRAAQSHNRMADLIGGKKVAVPSLPTAPDYGNPNTPTDDGNYSAAQGAWLRAHGANRAASDAPTSNSGLSPVSAPAHHIVRHSIAPSGGLSPAVAATNAELPAATANAGAPPGGLAPTPSPQPAGPSNSDMGDLPLGTPQAPTPTQDHPGILSRIASSLGDRVGDYASGLKHGDAQNWLPLISAIAAAGTAPTVHPGVALAAGLGAGAQSYMGTKKSLADVANTQAATGNVQAHTTGTQQANAINYARQEMLGLIKKDPAGTIVDPTTGTHYSNTQSGTSVIPGGAPAPTYKYLGPAAQDALSKSTQQFIKDSPGIGITPNEGNIATSNKIISDVQQSAADAQTAKTIQNEQAAALLSPDRKGVLSQGALAPVFQPYVEKFNSLVADSGHPEWAISGLGDQQISHKLQLGQAAMQSTGAGQHAYQALSDFTQLAPGGDLDPHAAATLMAQNAVAATKAIDQRDALAEAKQHAPNGNYEAQDLMTAFDRDNPPAVYNAMRDAVAGIYQNPAYATIHQALAKPGTPQYQKTINTLNAYGAQHGIPNFARVFTGG